MKPQVYGKGTVMRVMTHAAVGNLDLELCAGAVGGSGFTGIIRENVDLGFVRVSRSARGSWGGFGQTRNWGFVRVPWAARGSYGMV